MANPKYNQFPTRGGILPNIQQPTGGILSNTPPNPGGILSSTNKDFETLGIPGSSNANLLADPCYTKDVQPGEDDFEKAWKIAATMANESFRPIGSILNIHQEIFGRDNKDDLFIAPQNETLLECRDIKKDNGLYYGCTRQEGLEKNEIGLGNNYEKPYTRTYISEDWNINDVSKAMDHELEHQAVYSTRQAIYNDFLNRKKKGLKIPDDATLDFIMSKIQLLDHELDRLDRPYYVPTSGIHVNKLSNVYQDLLEITKQYQAHLN